MHVWYQSVFERQEILLGTKGLFGTTEIISHKLLSVLPIGLDRRISFPNSVTCRYLLLESLAISHQCRHYSLNQVT